MIHFSGKTKVTLFSGPPGSVLLAIRGDHALLADENGVITVQGTDVTECFSGLPTFTTSDDEAAS